VSAIANAFARARAPLRAQAFVQDAIKALQTNALGLACAISANPYATTGAANFKARPGFLLNFHHRFSSLQSLWKILRGRHYRRVAEDLNPR
jgi:hypothetical protein